MNCKQVNEIDLVDYLSKLGHQPQKAHNHDYWYLSPLREEKIPSFKVNQKLNLWYDHGIGKGGTVVDFGVLYYNCSVIDFLKRITRENELIFSFQPHQFVLLPTEKKKLPEQIGKIKILSNESITDSRLIQYLEARQIPVVIAAKFCEQVCFESYHKKHLAIGFKNDAGGYELRSHYFKGSSSPKQPTLLHESKSQSLSVFEGFFSFLSFQTLLYADQKYKAQMPASQTDFLILNSLSFFEKSRCLMEKYSSIHLYLDRDLMGLKCTAKALHWSDKYKDQSKSYKRFKDLNDYLLKNQNSGLKKSQNKGMHF